MKVITPTEVEQIYKDNFRRIYRFFYYKVLSRHIAEDLTSETFLNLVKAIKLHNENSTEIQNIDKFLYGIAYNVFLTHLKKKYKEDITVSNEFIDALSYIHGYVDAFEQKLDFVELALKYIDELPGKQKLVLTLRLKEKLSVKEIAEKLRKDMNYVKTTQKRAIKNLRKIIECTPFATNILNKNYV